MRPFDILDIDIFGESHSPEIGATVTGLPSGETFDAAEVAALAARRKSGKYLFSTPRREDDEAMWEGCTDLGDGRMRIDGALTVRIRNGNIRPSDYSYARTPHSPPLSCGLLRVGEGRRRGGAVGRRQILGQDDRSTRRDGRRGGSAPQKAGHPRRGIHRRARRRQRQRLRGRRTHLRGHRRLLGSRPPHALERR